MGNDPSELSDDSDHSDSTYRQDESEDMDTTVQDTDEDNSSSDKIIRDEHIVTNIEIVITLDDTIPMMIIGETEDCMCQRDYYSPPTLWI